MDDVIPAVNLRALLATQKLLASFVMMPRIEIVEIVGYAGFDLVVFDLEHGAVTNADLIALSAAARGVGLASIARLPNSSASDIGIALDSGVDGVMVPHVSSADEARAAVEATRFPPEGGRSLNPFTRGNGYGMTGGSLTDLNERAALIAMIEGDAAVRDIDSILTVDGLDGVFVGPVDLSGAMGYAGQPDHPDVVAAVETVVARVSQQGMSAGLYVSEPRQAADWFSRGAGLVALSADIAMTAQAFTEVARSARSQ